MFIYDLNQEQHTSQFGASTHSCHYLFPCCFVPIHITTSWHLRPGPLPRSQVIGIMGTHNINEFRCSHFLLLKISSLACVFRIHPVPHFLVCQFLLLLPDKKRGDVAVNATPRMLARLARFVGFSHSSRRHINLSRTRRLKNHAANLPIVPAGTNRRRSGRSVRYPDTRDSQPENQSIIPSYHIGAADLPIRPLRD